MKELKLKIEKFDKAIAFQTLKITNCIDSEHVKFSASPAILEDNSEFVAIKNLVNNTLLFRQKELVYSVLGKKLGTGTDRQPRP